MKLADAARVLAVFMPNRAEKPPPLPPIVKRGPKEADDIVQRLIASRVDQSDGGLIKVRHVRAATYACVWLLPWVKPGPIATCRVTGVQRSLAHHGRHGERQAILDRLFFGAVVAAAYPPIFSKVSPKSLK
jgi:hypothetical protein